MKSASKYNKSARTRAQSVPIRMSTATTKNRTTESVCRRGRSFPLKKKNNNN